MDNSKKIKAVVFDMDGTVLNTLDDLTTSVNYSLNKLGYSEIYDNSIVRMFFGSGVRVAFERALAYKRGCSEAELEYIGTADYKGEYKADKETNAEIDKLLDIYIPHYNEHCNDKTRAYDGIKETIKHLRDKGIKTAVVSNKPDAAVKMLCRDVFPGMFDYDLGELSGVNRKPDRAMVDMCLCNLGVSAAEAVYVGDSEIDLLTAKNSEMDCVAVTWGFRGRSFLEAHGAETIIDEPSQLINILNL